MYIEEDNWNTYGVPILSKATIRATITNVVASMQLEGDFFLLLLLLLSRVVTS